MPIEQVIILVSVVGLCSFMVGKTSSNPSKESYYRLCSVVEFLILETNKMYKEMQVLKGEIDIND